MSALAAWSLGMLAASALLLPVTASSNEAGFLALPVTQHSTQDLRGLSARQTNHQLQKGGYRDTWHLVDVEIGSPKQKVQLVIDLNGYEIDVVGSCDGFDDTEVEKCIQTGTYNVNASDTANLNRDKDSERYKTNEEWDDLTIGGYETLKNVTFLYWTESNSNRYIGSLGLGYGRGINTNMDSIMDVLADQKVIDSKSFALTLAGDDSSGGSLVFGGVDTKKFAGPMHKMLMEPPTTVWPRREYPYGYSIQVENVTLDDGTGNATTLPGFNAALFSYAMGSILTDDVMRVMARAFGVDTLNASDASTEVDCKWRDRDSGSLVLEFPGDVKVPIPYSEFVMYGAFNDGSRDESRCYIYSGPRTEEAQTVILDSSFLRYAYAVFDQDEKAVHVARYQDCGSEVVKFEGGEEIRGQCEEGSESGGSGSSSGGTQDGGDGGSVGARVGVAMGAVVFAAAMSLAGL